MYQDAPVWRTAAGVMADREWEISGFANESDLSDLSDLLCR
jgi:hypothetical protein